MQPPTRQLNAIQPEPHPVVLNTIQMKTYEANQGFIGYV